MYVRQNSKSAEKDKKLQKSAEETPKMQKKLKYFKNVRGNLYSQNDIWSSLVAILPCVVPGAGVSAAAGLGPGVGVEVEVEGAGTPAWPRRS